MGVAGASDFFLLEGKNERESGNGKALLGWILCGRRRVGRNMPILALTLPVKYRRFHHLSEQEETFYGTESIRESLASACGGNS